VPIRGRCHKGMETCFSPLFETDKKAYGSHIALGLTATIRSHVGVAQSLLRMVFWLTPPSGLAHTPIKSAIVSPQIFLAEFAFTPTPP
jgi:hypothetical protein